MRRSLVEAAGFVVASFERLGQRVDPSSRYARMLDALSAGYISPEDPKFDAAIESIRDVQLLEFVFDQYAQTGSESHIEPFLNRIVRDSVLPQDDRENSPGRDRVFELYLGAVHVKAGSFEEFCEPDVGVTIDGTRHGIAAKRLKQMSSVEKHVRKASSQIQKSGMPGHIALDITVASNPSNDRQVVAGDEAMALAIRKATNAFGHEYLPKIRKWKKDADVVSVVLQTHMVVYVPKDGWQLSTATQYLPVAMTGNAPVREFDLFREAFSRGLATPPTPA